MKTIMKKCLFIAIFLTISPLFGIGRCECNNGCDAIVDRLKPGDILEGDPRELCPQLCIRNGGWSGEFSNNPNESRPFC